MGLNYNYSKYKLPKYRGYSYPLKKKEIDAALEEGNVSELGRLYFSIDYKDSELVVLFACLSGESRAGYWMKQEPRLGIYAVPIRIVGEVRQLLEKTDMLARVVRWLKRLESASNVCRDVGQKIMVYYKDRELFIKDENNKEIKLP
nr:hypothetical protein [uncultured Pseudodesulfovibrio sp.]